jgi:hypothetical protein
MGWHVALNLYEDRGTFARFALYYLDKHSECRTINFYYEISLFLPSGGSSFYNRDELTPHILFLVLCVFLVLVGVHVPVQGSGITRQWKIRRGHNPSHIKLFENFMPHPSLGLMPLLIIQNLKAKS